MNSTSDPTVNAVVMNWNGRPWLEQVLPSLRAQDYPNLRVIVADCNSRDGSAAWVREHFPEVTVRAIPFDCSPPYANNLIAREYECDWICILNNDVVLPPDCIRKLVEASRAAPPDAILNPVQLDWEGSFFSVGLADPVVGKMFTVLRFLPRTFFRRFERPFYPCTACCLVARSTLLRMPLNEDLFIYEDVDWGWRVVAAGGEMEACENAVFFHAGSRTFNSSARRVHMSVRNLAAGVWMSAPPLLALLLLPWYVAWYAGWFLSSLVKRRSVKPFWTGAVECLQMHRVWTRNRRERQHERRRSNWEMFCRMAGSVDFAEHSRQRWVSRWPEPWARPSTVPEAIAEPARPASLAVAAAAEQGQRY